VNYRIGKRPATSRVPTNYPNRHRCIPNRCTQNVGPCGVGVSNADCDQRFWWQVSRT